MMDTRWLVITLLMSQVLASAADFKLIDGKEYRKVKVSRVEPDGIVVITHYGIIKLFFTELPKEIQEKYHYNPKQAEAFRFQLDAARDLATEQVTASKERRESARNTEVQQPTQKPLQSDTAALSLEVHEVGTGDGTMNRWYVDWDYYSRDFVRQKTLLVSVRDFSRKIRGVVVQIYFIGHPLERDTPLFVYGHAAIPVEFEGNLEISGTIDAPPLEGSKTRIGGYQSLHGSDIEGWIVIGEIRHERFQIRASSQRLLDLAEHNPQELEKMTAAYESKTRDR